MKIRNGFVSNSSSSSFVIAFDKRPKNVQDVLTALYPDGKGVDNPWKYNDDSRGVDALTAATLIWEQIEGQMAISKGKILEKIKSGYFEGYPDLSERFEEPDRISEEYTSLTGKNIRDEDADLDWKKKYDKALQASLKSFYKRVKEASKFLFDRIYPLKFKGKKCFVVSFSDNDGEVGAVLEHGDTFRNIPHEKISHH